MEEVGSEEVGLEEVGLEEEWIEGEGIVLQDIALVSGVVGISRYPVSRLEGRGTMFLER